MPTLDESWDANAATTLRDDATWTVWSEVWFD
ncbi:hypothetical protein FOYG_06130 [Fusarium oxysporum NRRL 32931]|uniref:Uncharacterized protein n=2 Tax=Fusarium oxysporum TaxID=5507 RepID=W9IH16_FUSOX|nr:hypothetical protein FOYG_06130 [Fusarium oxysporum NRRL 32931]EXA51656.1 hypothetical protein FOVG_00252 [Fusarium oxysporum f. sp. pisi HDV247]